MRSIVDRFGTSYVVETKLVGGMIIYTAHTGDTVVARAALNPGAGDNGTGALARTNRGYGFSTPASACPLAARHAAG
jgi:hypothetical protein